MRRNSISLLYSPFHGVDESPALKTEVFSLLGKAAHLFAALPSITIYSDGQRDST
jgi:hypothetical protein